MTYSRLISLIFSYFEALCGVFSDERGPDRMSDQIPHPQTFSERLGVGVVLSRSKWAILKPFQA